MSRPMVPATRPECDSPKGDRERAAARWDSLAVTQKRLMPVQQIQMTEHQQQALALFAARMGMTVEDAASLLAKEAMARRMTPNNAKVIPWPGRRN